MKQKTKTIKHVKIEVDLRPRSPPIKRLYRLKRTLLFENAFSPPESSAFRDFEFWESEKSHRHELNQIKHTNEQVPNSKFNKMSQEDKDRNILLWSRHRPKNQLSNHSFQATLQIEPIIDKVMKLRKKSCECSECGFPSKKEVQSSINLNNEVRYFTVRRIKRKFRKYVWAVIAVLKYRQILVQNVRRYKQYIRKKNTFLENPMTHSLVTHSQVSHSKVPSMKDLIPGPLEQSTASTPSKLLKQFNTQTMFKPVLKPIIQVPVPAKENKTQSILYIYDHNVHRGSVTKYLSEKIMERIKQKDQEESDNQNSQPNSPMIKKSKQTNFKLKLNLPSLNNKHSNQSMNYPFFVPAYYSLNIKYFRQKDSPRYHQSTKSIAQLDKLQSERITRYTSYTQHTQQSSILQSRLVSDLDVIPLVKYQSYATLKKLRQDILKTKTIQSKIVLPRAMILK